MTVEIGVLYTGPMPGDPYDEYERFMRALPGGVTARTAFSRSDAVRGTAARVRVEVDPLQAAPEPGFPRRNRGEVEFRRLTRPCWSSGWADALIEAIDCVERADLRALSLLLEPDVPGTPAARPA